MSAVADRPGWSRSAQLDVPSSHREALGEEFTELARRVREAQNLAQRSAGLRSPLRFPLHPGAVSDGVTGWLLWRLLLSHGVRPDRQWLPWPSLLPFWMQTEAALLFNHRTASDWPVLEQRMAALPAPNQRLLIAAVRQRGTAAFHQILDEVEAVPPEDAAPTMSVLRTGDAPGVGAAHAAVRPPSDPG